MHSAFASCASESLTEKPIGICRARFDEPAVLSVKQSARLFVSVVEQLCLLQQQLLPESSLFSLRHRLTTLVGAFHALAWLLVANSSLG